MSLVFMGLRFPKTQTLINEEDYCSPCRTSLNRKLYFLDFIFLFSVGIVIRKDLTSNSSMSQPGCQLARVDRGGARDSNLFKWISTYITLNNNNKIK